MRFAIVAVLMLSACTTVTEMRDHNPRMVYESSKSAAALEYCLAGRLSWVGLPAIIRGEDRTELAFGDPDQMALLIGLIPKESGTTVEVRQKLTYGARVRGNIETCLA